MKKLYIISFFVLMATTLFGQEMQKLNQFYFDKEHEEKVLTAANSIKSQVDATMIQNAKNAVIALDPTKITLIQATDVVNEVMKPASDDKSINEISVLPAFTSLIGNNVLLPKLEIGGTTDFKSGEKFYGDVKLFTSPNISKQTSNPNVFFPETSTYGIAMSINYLPKKWGEHTYKTITGEEAEAKWFCAYLNLNYLGKSLYGVDEVDGVNDTTRFTSDFTHIKYGIQIIPFRNVLSFYADVNHLTALTNRGPLEKYLPALANGVTNFFTVGTKFFLTKGGDGKPLNLFVDFSAVVTSGHTKKIYNTTDKIIPKIGIGSAIRF